MESLTYDRLTYDISTSRQCKSDTQSVENTLQILSFDFFSQANSMWYHTVL